MKEKNVKYIYPLIALGVGLLFITLLKLPYTSILDGYDLLELYTTGFLGFVIMMSQFLQIAILLLLLNFGILGLLEKNGVVEFKKRIWNCSYNLFVKILITIVAGLSFLSLMLLIIFCLVESKAMSFGAIINCILEVICVVLVWLLSSKGILEGTYVAPKKKTKKQKQEKINEEEMQELKFEDENQIANSDDNL